MTMRDELRLILERHCTALINGLADQIDRPDLELLDDFVQNYEYGLALETLEALIVERSVSLTEQQKSEIRQLKRQMNMSLDEN
jgi:hypothetical protein